MATSLLAYWEQYPPPIVGGGGGISGITVQEEGVTVGTPAGITVVNFVGTLSTATGVGATAKITLASPLTTKGDIFGRSTVDDRIPVGTDTFVLTADSTQALGVKWAAVAVSPTLFDWGKAIHAARCTWGY